eukprot:scaffold43350_cov29-Tisochrysis_lutea.AAC.3
MSEDRSRCVAVLETRGLRGWHGRPPPRQGRRDLPCRLTCYRPLPLKLTPKASRLLIRRRPRIRR